jgi:hypothetical protein
VSAGVSRAVRIRVQTPGEGPSSERTVAHIFGEYGESLYDLHRRAIAWCKQEGLNPAYTWIDDIT